ncbi:unnamed protein product, partial [Mesorhabditis spiculigera]
MPRANDSSIEYPPGCGPVSPEMRDSELIKKLNAMTNTFMTLDTETTKSADIKFRPLAQHLIKDEFVAHSNREIQVYIANCLAGIFRLSSPNNPFIRPEDTNKALTCLIDGLRGLEKPDSAIYRRHYYILENLYAMGTLGLVTEISEKDQQELLRHTIVTLFGIAGKLKDPAKEGSAEPPLDEDAEEKPEPAANGDEFDEVAEKEGSVIQILSLSVMVISNLLTEVPMISDQAMDAIFVNLTTPTKLNSPNCYRLAKKVIMAASTVLSAPFHELCAQVGVTNRMPDDFSLCGGSATKLYQVICEIHALVPEMAYPVLQIFQKHLSSPDSEVRYKATKIMCVLIGHDNGRLADEQEALWLNFLKRFSDANKDIRALCAAQAGELLVDQPSLSGTMCERLIRLLADEDEEVRIAALASTSLAGCRKLEAVTEQLIAAAASRIMDKKPKVRAHAIRELSKLHWKIYRDERYTTNDRATISVIAKKIFYLYSQPEMRDEKMLIERRFVGAIIPYQLPRDRRIAVALEVYARLTTYEAAFFAELLATQSQYRRAILDILLLSARTGQGEQIDELKLEIEKRIAKTVHGVPSQKYMHALRFFTNFISKDQHAFELVEYMLKPGYTCEKVLQNMTEFLNRATERHSNDRSFPAEFRTMVKELFERSMPLQIDTETAGEICGYVLKMVKRAECRDAKALELLPKLLELWKLFALHNSHCFASEMVVPEILSIITREHCPDIAVEAGVQVLLHVCEQSIIKVSEHSWADEAVKICVELSRRGPPGAAKGTVVCVCRLLGRAEAKDTVVGMAKAALKHLDINDPQCVTALQTLSRTINAYPSEMRAELRPIITSDIVTKICLSPEVDEGPQEIERELSTATCPPILKRKIYAMKYLVRFLTNVRRDDDDLALVEKIITLFRTFLSVAGDVHDARMSSLEQAWFRAYAGAAIIRLAYVTKYLAQIPVAALQMVSHLLLDESAAVRVYVGRRLRKAFARRMVSIEFSGMWSLAPLVQEEDSKREGYLNVVRGDLDVALRLYRQTSLLPDTVLKLHYFQPELFLPYSLHFLANSGFCNDLAEKEDLDDVIRCLTFVISIFFTDPTKRYNLDLSLAFLQMVKDSEDATIPPDATKSEREKRNQNLWILADLSTAILASMSKQLLSASSHNLWAPAAIMDQLRAGKWKPGKKLSGNSTAQGKATNGRIRRKRRQTRSDSESEETIEEQHEAEEEERSLEDATASDQKNTTQRRNVSASSAPGKRSSPTKQPALKKNRPSRFIPNDEIAPSPIRQNGRATRSTLEPGFTASTPVEKDPKAKRGKHVSDADTVSPAPPVRSSQQKTPSPSKKPTRIGRRLTGGTQGSTTSSQTAMANNLKLQDSQEREKKPAAKKSSSTSKVQAKTKNSAPAPAKKPSKPEPKTAAAAPSQRPRRAARK